LLLLKGSDDIEVQVDTMDPPDPASPDDRYVRITTDIRHNAGGTVELGSIGYADIKRWIESGFQRSGIPDETLVESVGSCVRGVGSHPFFDPSVPPADTASYDRFRNEVHPVIRETCAGSRCHGSTIADFFYSCGDSEEELRWNYFVAVAHIAEQVSTSDLLRRPLSQLRGGSYHEGGNVFGSAEDDRYLTIRGWAEDLVARVPTAIQYPATVEPGFRFFVNRVEPVLVRKGCMFLNCHSPAMFHDLRLRGGSQGVFSRVATWRNYEMSKLLLAIESPDPNQSRIIAKNLYPPTQIPGGDGLLHRGGSLFEDFGLMGTTVNLADPTDCTGVDADTGDLNTIPAYCVLARWHEIERTAAIASGELLPDPIDAVVWVSRPPGAGEIRDFDTYRGGAELMIADATIDATGALTLSGERSLNAMCGIGDADIRQPAVSWDGARIAFAARQGAGQPFAIWEMNADGSACAAVPSIAHEAPMENGIFTHDIDPAYAPDGRLVFASSRGNTMGDFPYDGPTRTPAAMQPNANLFVRDAPGAVRQLTFLLNQELAPSFMGDGRLIFTGEKRETEFHQLAGRRQNLDGGDYHPLFAQRESVGFRSATEISELPNRNLVFVAAPLGTTDSAGGIAIVNRSIGPDQDDRDAYYPGDRLYLSSLDFPAGGALVGGSGAFRSPAPLPSGRVLASCDTGAGSLTGGAFAFSLCEIDVSTGAVRAVGGVGGRANVDAVAVYARPNYGVFQSRPDEANGHTYIEPGQNDAEILVQDFPLLATLLFANRRTNRPISSDVGGFDVFEATPPPAGSMDYNDMDSFGPFYRNYEHRGWTGLEGDGSAHIRVNGGAPILLRATDGGGSPLMFGEGGAFAGEMIQREQMQFYPGERGNQSLRRTFFNGLCAGCHGSISGRELDIAVNVDVLTSASAVMAADNSPAGMTR
jgi:hypothetical protein